MSITAESMIALIPKAIMSNQESTTMFLMQHRRMEGMYQTPEFGEELRVLTLDIAMVGSA